VQPIVLERLFDAYRRDLISAKSQARSGPDGFLLAEIMGDVLAKQDKANLPDKLFQEVRDVFRKDLEWFASHRFGSPELTPEQEKQREYLIRGFLPMAKYFEKTDIALITDKLGPSLAVAMREKNWEIPTDLQPHFVTHVMANIYGNTAKSALDCLSSMGQVLTKQDLETWARKVRELEATDPTIVEANAQALLNVIGTQGVSKEVRSAAISTLEKTGWYSKLDSEIRDALSYYVYGRVTDVKLIDQVIALIGDCRIEPPIAVVVARMGIPLTSELIRDVDAAERNLGGDRKAFLKVLERVAALNALAPELTQLPKCDLSKLIKRMASAPLAEDPEFGFLVTDATERRLAVIENAVLDKLVAKSNEYSAAAGLPPLSRGQIRAGVFNDEQTTTCTLGSAKAGYEQSVKSLTQVTRDGHQTSYWWLAALGVGYVIRRFGPGGTQRQFEDKQREAVNDWKAARRELGKSMAETEGLKAVLHTVENARDVAKYVRQVGEGDISRSDKTALRLLQNMGKENLHDVAPFIWKGIYGTPPTRLFKGQDGKYFHEDEWKGGEIWQRLKRSNATSMEKPPKFMSMKEALDGLTKP
ncbi:MAG: hypothetical protein K2Z81_08580, partial [Cyanobacteria bacterium]|nr:hypothetical protein [Cyanobacteriota bacterium]